MRRSYYRFTGRSGCLNASAVKAWGRLADIALAIGRRERAGIEDWAELRRCAEAVRTLPVIGVYDDMNACHRLRMEVFAWLAARPWKHEVMAALAETVAEMARRESAVAEAAQELRRRV